MILTLTKYAPCQFCCELAPHRVERISDGKRIYVCTRCLRLICVQGAPFERVPEHTRSM